MIYYLEFLLTPTFPALHLLSIFLGSIYWYGLCTEMCSTDPGLARMFHELLSRDHEDGCASGQPQGVGSEAYLNGTSQVPTPEDARKDGHIRGRSRLFVKYPG
jgi:hypothetical protein